MRLSDAEMRRIAAAIVTRLEKADLLRVGGSRAAVELAIAEAIRGNVRAEQEIEAEAERFADSHGRELVGMDRHKVLQLLKERIAKERGFTL